MKIYTKTGDKGETSLFGGKRVSKDDLCVETYGTVDELNSVVGICRTLNPPKKVDQLLYSIQNQLFTLGADLATPLSQKLKQEIPRISKGDIAFLEKSIDDLETTNEPLQAFILPGGSHLAAHLHLARTVCRRAERSVVKLSRKEKIGKHIVVYLNRLSDFLFVLARWMNKNQNIAEIKWNNKR
ncbi:MAG: cob(I)yrinic acid a,c-diamide adenosyltransferase [Bacteroidota bacterium]|nr:cob(I)yrinic acid a,c-diamide adenosyltransferase [Bacteroidota bacterium]